MPDWHGPRSLRPLTFFALDPASGVAERARAEPVDAVFYGQVLMDVAQ